MPMTPIHKLTPRDDQALAWLYQTRDYIFEGHSSAVNAAQVVVLALQIQEGDMPEDALEIEAMP